MSGLIVCISCLSSETGLEEFIEGGLLLDLNTGVMGSEQLVEFFFHIVNKVEKAFGRLANHL